MFQGPSSFAPSQVREYALHVGKKVHLIIVYNEQGQVSSV